MAKNKDKHKIAQPIKSLSDLQREKAKAQERLTYTQSLIEEEWDTLRDQVRPASLLGNIERFLPLLTNFGSLSRITSSLLRSRAKGKKAADQKQENTDETAGKDPKEGWASWLKKGFYRALVPLIVGTVASTALFRRNRS